MGAIVATQIRVPALLTPEMRRSFEQIVQHMHTEIANVAKLPATGNAVDDVAVKVNELIDALVTAGYMKTA